MIASADTVYRDKIINHVTGSTPTVFALHQLPSPPADFTGREEDLEALRSILTQGGSAAIFGLRGMGGVGKTVLALKLAEEFASRYPDAQLYLDLKGVDPQPLTPTQAMAHVVRSFEPEVRLPETEAELAGLYRSVLFQKRVLLLMDNAADRHQVEPLIPPAGSILLVTSRVRFTLPGMAARDLDEMSGEDARKLLLTIAPRVASNAEEIAHLCGRLPLALRLAASTLAERPSLSPARYIRRFKEGKERFSGVDAALDLSYRLLDDTERHLWRLLAVFPSTFDSSAVAAIWEIASDDAQEVLGELVRGSLIEWMKNDDRYRLHDLFRAFAHDRLKVAEREHIFRLFSVYFLELLRSIQISYFQGKDSTYLALKNFDLEWDNIQSGHFWAASYSKHDLGAINLCANYPDAGAQILSLRQHVSDRIRWRELGLIAARQLKDKALEITHLANLGFAYADAGLTRKAIELLERYLAVSQEIGDLRGEGQALGSLGDAYQDLGEVHVALGLHGQHLSIARKIGDRREEGNALGSLGHVYAALGENHRALELHDQQLRIARSLGDIPAEGSALGSLGNVYNAVGDFPQSIRFHEEFLIIAQKLGDRRNEGIALTNLGSAHAALGNVRRAMEFQERALAITREISDRHGEGIILGNLANSYASLGDAQRAIDLQEQRISIAREIGDRHGEARASWNLGFAYLAKGDFSRAADLMSVWVDFERELALPEAERDAAQVESIRTLLGSPNPTPPWPLWRRLLKSLTESLVRIRRKRA